MWMCMQDRVGECGGGPSPLPLWLPLEKEGPRPLLKARDKHHDIV